MKFWLVTLILFAVEANAQSTVYVRGRDAFGTFWVGDSVNGALRVNCVIGCGGGEGGGALTDTELRATPVPVSGTVAVSNFPTSAVAVAINDGQCLTLTTTSSTISASNANRKYISLYLEEGSTDTVFLKLGATATTSDLRLAIGQSFTLDNPIYTGTIDGRSNSGSQSVCLVEF